MKKRCIGGKHTTPVDMMNRSAPLGATVRDGGCSNFGNAFSDLHLW